MARQLKRAGAVGGICALALIGWGVFARARDVSEMQAWADRRAEPTVRVIMPQARGAAEALELPGQLQAYNDAAIYARVPGYLKSWNEDIGAKVKAGQLLAVIDAPELDQQLAEAQADLATARANLKLAKVTADRFGDLVSDDAVSKQDADEKAGAYEARQAALQAAQANVQRLRALEGFKRIVAPFDGVVTQRNANIGALVNAGAGAAPASALFNVADVHKLRVYVHVPQSFSASVRPGMAAILTLPQYPGRTFPASVVRDAGAVGSQTGTLLVELEVANPDSLLKPGDYAQAVFRMPSGVGLVRVPASALVFRAQGLQVATLDAGDRVKLRSVSIARDLGSEVEINGGLGPGDRVIDTPPDSIADGDKVRVQQAARAGGGHARG